MEADRRYQVFVSSTLEDLKLERAQVTQSILELNHIPAGMELFPASDETQWEVIRRVIDQSDYYIVLVAGRYGSTDKRGTSYTEKEYDYAVGAGVPIMSFLRADIDRLPSNICEKSEIRQKRLAEFRNKLQQRHCRLWHTPEELGLLVSKSLNYTIQNFPRVGWVRADRAKSISDFEQLEQLRKEVEGLRERNEELSRYVRDTVLPLEGVASTELQDDQDTFEFSISFTSKDRGPVSKKVAVSWSQVLGALGPGMYGYLHKRETDAYSTDYFDRALCELIREQIFADVQNRKIILADSEIDTVLFQLKQLGYLSLESNEKGYRGWTLTPKGEEKLTRLKVRLRSTK